MQAGEVINCLREHKQELVAKGVLGLHLFGSVARGEQSPNDIDLAANFDRSRLSLLDLSSIQDQLSDLLGAKVDLSDGTMLKEYIRQNAEFLLVF
jgi:predicted nucleotidyltransferase